MSEKLSEVFEQYDMEITDTRKGRGSTILITKEGMRILEPFRGSMVRLEQEYVLKQLFLERGLERLDHIIPNRDGQLFTCDKYRQPYVMKKHFEGEECDMNDPGDVVKAVEALAKFHLQGQWVAKEFEVRWSERRRQNEEQRVEEIRRVIEDGEEMERVAYLYEISRSALQKAINQEKQQNDPKTEKKEIDEIHTADVYDRFVRHNAQIRKIGRFVRRVKRRNAFENLFLNIYEDFYRQGAACVSMLEKGIEKNCSCLMSGCGDKDADAMDSCRGDEDLSVFKSGVKGEKEEKYTGCVGIDHYGICHGSFNQHNVIMGEDGIAIVHFERFSRGNQLGDLYQFARKVMEKNGYQFALLQEIIDAYNKVIRITKEDYEYMYILFSYPEKFWKIANRYYNSSKAFLSPKYIEKLEGVICQEKEKKEMLDNMKRIVFAAE